MAISTREIVDDQLKVELIIIGSNSGDSYTINTSDLFDSVQINGVDKQRMSILVEYSLDPNCMLKVEFATDDSGSFTSIKSGKTMSINGSAPSTTLNATAESVVQTASSGPGTSATFNITSTGGVISLVTSVSEGSGYANGNTITFSQASLTALGTLGTVGGDLVIDVETGTEHWNGYGTDKVFIKNEIENSNGDIRITFVGGPGCCKVSAMKTEGFTLASPYYRKVSGRIS
tara:strand:+ start:592 stop:1287 length:696 start_codon:yes stop_codon:yes gene_type:complete